MLACTIADHDATWKVRRQRLCSRCRVVLQHGAICFAFLASFGTLAPSGRELNPIHVLWNVRSSAFAAATNPASYRKHDRCRKLKVGYSHRERLGFCQEPASIQSGVVLFSAAVLFAGPTALSRRRRHKTRCARDPGRAELHSEWSFFGNTLFYEKLDGGGQVTVQTHRCSEQYSCEHAPRGSTHEWRTLAFKPHSRNRRASGLIQSVTKVWLEPPASDGKQRARLCAEVLPLAYTKSLASAVLAALAVVGAPVYPHQGPTPLRVLFIGLGAGSVPSFFAEALPHCIVDVAELEPIVVRAATEAMGFEAGPRLRVSIEDGVAFAARALENHMQPAGGRSEACCNNGVYDAVIVDAYDAEGNVPSTLWSKDCDLCKLLTRGLLRKHGVIVANFLDDIDLTEPLAAYRSALQSRGGGRSFSVQALLSDGSPSGNLMAVHTCGGPPEHKTMSFGKLRKELAFAGTQIGLLTSCSFDMGALAARNLREWPPG